MPRLLVLLVSSLILTGCLEKGGGGGSAKPPAKPTPPVTEPAKPPVEPSTPPPVSDSDNANNFYDQPTLLANLPEFPANAQEPYDSYVNASSKGNDQGSTKRLDLIRWYNAIRHADTSSPYRNFDGSARVYAEPPSFAKGNQRIGILSKAYAENHLDYYNFMRALFGAQRVYMSGYKQVSAQASSFSDLNGHYPTAAEGASKGFTGAFFDAIAFGRGSSNLQGGSLNRSWDYAAATRLNRNGDLTGIWNEGEWDNIATLGHRLSFMFPPGKDIGAGLMAGYHSWQSWGADPMRNNGNLLGGAEQQRIHDSYPAGRTPNGVQVWPSHGYFPFFALAGRNQSWGMKLYSADVSAPSQDEAVTLRMEYFVHEQDGDLSTLSNPVASIEVSDIKGSGVNFGGKGALNAQGLPDYDGPDFITPQAGAVLGGGYHFTLDGANFPTQFRMPQAWFAQMQADFSSAKPKYHTVRYTFVSTGRGLRVKRPFYMNPLIDAPLVVQTTFFDPQKNTESSTDSTTPLPEGTPPVVAPPPAVVPPITPPPAVTPPDEDNDNEHTGGNGGTDEDHITPPEVPSPPPVIVPPSFAEPTGKSDDEISAIGFYDIDASGQPRAVRHDLSGSLPAMVQFVQSHSVDPSGNAAKNMPTLASEREALLLVTPEPSLGKLQKLTLNATLNGQPLPPLELRSPNELYRSDYSNNDGRPDLTYSHRAWSVVLPWDQVKPGLSLSLTDEQGRNGQLTADSIEFAAPAELVLHTIRLGMLSTPPQSGGHWLSLQPAKAITDYFQTIPAAKITAAQYEDAHFAQVMVASGVIYTEPGASATEGGAYSGDMRENTGKSTVSVGINLANYGVTSSSMASQNQPQLFQSVVAHHSRGNYSNGLQSHGLSGGNGMLTLYDSQGNEFSHEIGHHLGLGHYPGSDVLPGSGFWSNHHADSGWGFIGQRKRMRANVHWTAGANANTQGGATHKFLDLYSYAPDAMSGGAFASNLSRYTHYTGYSAKTSIQPRLDREMLSSTSSTGYLKWNPTTRRMAESSPSVPNSNSPVWYNGGDAGKFRKPRLIGVPVFTILGGYVPATGSAVLYPALRSNWGNVFDLPAPTDIAAATSRQCWLSVDYANGSNQRIAVAGSSLETNVKVPANKLHIQLAESDQPTAASLFCQAPADAVPQQLASIAIPQGLPPMPAPVVVGKEARYSALRAVELPEFEQALMAQSNRAVVSLSGNAALLNDSYGDEPAGLSSDATAVLTRLQDQQARAQRLNRWINTYRAQLEQGNPHADAALLDFINTLNLRNTPLLPASQTLKVNGNCLKVETVDGVLKPYIEAAAQCTGALAEQWLQDASKRIRSAQDLSQCLTDQGGSNAVGLSNCDLLKDTQTWELSASDQIKRGGRCMDLSGGYLSNSRGTAITYGCTGGGNQRWLGLTGNSDNLLLLLVSKQNLPQIVRLANSPAR